MNYYSIKYDMDCIYFIRKLKETAKEMNIDYEIVCYGLRVEGAWFLDCLIAIFVSSLFNVTINALVYITVFSFLRAFCGGYHCKTYMTCGCSYIIMVTISSLLSTFVSEYLSIAIFFLAAQYLYMVSPVENENNTIDKNDFPYFHKIVKKRLTIVMIGMTLLFYYYPILTNSISNALLSLSILCWIQRKRNNEYL